MPVVEDDVDGLATGGDVDVAREDAGHTRLPPGQLDMHAARWNREFEGPGLEHSFAPGAGGNSDVPSRSNRGC